MTAVAWRWDKVFAGWEFCCRMNWMMYGGKVKCKSWFARFWLFAEAVRQKWGRGAGISLTTALQLSAWLSSDTLTKVTNKNYIFLLESETAKTKVIKNRALSFRSPVPGSYHNPYWCMLSRNHFSNVHSRETKGKFKLSNSRLAYGWFGGNLQFNVVHPTALKCSSWIEPVMSAVGC